MVKNYLTVMWRQLRRDTFYSTINIVSLVAALTCCSIIVLYVRYELSYDRFHHQPDHIYRLVTTRGDPAPLHSVRSPGGIGPVLEQQFPEVAAATALQPGNLNYVTIDGQRVRVPSAGFIGVDSSFFNVFSFPLLAGDPNTALNEPGSMVITEAMADLLFPNQNPLGKSIQTRRIWTVTGVAADPPDHSHFTFHFLAAGLTARPEVYWFSQGIPVYLRLTEPDAAPQLEAKLNAFAQTQISQGISAGQLPEWLTLSFELQPLTYIHLHSHLEGELAINGDIANIRLLGVLAFLLIVVAMINYVNLATARYVQRAREVGVRKVLGAHHRQLVRQFLGEAALLSLGAGGIALLLIALAIPVVEDFTGKAFTLHLWDAGLFLLLTVGVGLLAGAYPAFFLARFHPAATLKGVFRSGRSDMIMRRTLIGLQLLATIGLATGASIIYAQLRYLQQERLGFDKEQVLIIETWTGIGEVYDAFKEELLREPGIVSVTSGYHPGESTGGWMIEDESSGAGWLLHRYEVGYDYFETLGLTILEGRAFSRDHPSDSLDSVILSESAVKRLGLEAPVVGQQYDVFDRGEPKTIVGVVEDFNILSYREPSAPVMMTLAKPGYAHTIIKLRTGNVRETVPRIEAMYEQLRPEHPILYYFLDAKYEALFRSERRFGILFSVFSLVAVGVAFLGLFGLAAYAAQRRTKEIGVRRVLGASTASIMLLLTKEFVKLVVVAAAVAVPIAYIWGVHWLSDYAFRVELRPMLFLSVAGAALGLVLLAVSAQAFRAAMADPVKNLRIE